MGGGGVSHYNMFALLLLIPIIQAQIVIEHSVDLSKSRVVIVPLPAPPTSDVIHHFSFILPPAPSDKMTQLTANITASDSLSYSVWDMYALSTSITSDIQCKSHTLSLCSLSEHTPTLSYL